MDARKKSLRVGITAILCAFVFRFFSPGTWIPVAEFLTRPETVAFLTYPETGCRVQFSPGGDILPEKIPDARLTFSPESPGPVLPETVIPVFSDASVISMYYGCNYRPDVDLLLQKPLSWDLQTGAPTVLIYHTHTTESYRKFGQTYEETAAYRTLDPHYNIVSIGDRVTELLEEAGISVIHDTEVHDYPSYNTSYMHSRLAVQKLLKENPSLQLVLDLHRDAIEGPEGQMKTAANVGGSTSAQLMVVVGTNCRLKHDRWPENLALGLKLHAQLETQTPGIVRPLSLRPQRFNQDLSPGALLIEVGAAGNSRGEAMLAAEELARAIIAISRGTATADWEDSASDPPAVPAADF